MYVQLICKKATSYFENRRGSYPYKRVTLLVATRPSARHFYHFSNRSFPLKNPVKKFTGNTYVFY